MSHGELQASFGSSEVAEPVLLLFYVFVPKLDSETKEPRKEMTNAQIVEFLWLATGIDGFRKVTGPLQLDAEVQRGDRWANEAFDAKVWLAENGFPVVRIMDSQFNWETEQHFILTSAETLAYREIPPEDWAIL